MERSNPETCRLQTAAKSMTHIRGMIVNGDLPLSAVGGIDESPFWFDPPSSGSNDFQGLKMIKMKAWYEKKCASQWLSAYGCLHACMRRQLSFFGVSSRDSL